MHMYVCVGMFLCLAACRNLVAMGKPEDSLAGIVNIEIKNNSTVEIVLNAQLLARKGRSAMSLFFMQPHETKIITLFVGYYVLQATALLTDSKTRVWTTNIENDMRCDLYIQRTDHQVNMPNLILTDQEYTLKRADSMQSSKKYGQTRIAGRCGIQRSPSIEDFTLAQL